MSGAMPWRDTPKNRERWARLQNSYTFLLDQQALYGRLQCHHCGRAPLTIVHWDDRYSQNDPMKATVDHVIPVSRGGPDCFDNMVVSCAPCNYRKGTS